MPMAWLLKAHPTDLSGFLGELCFGMRGVGPIVEPPVNYWRGNRMVLLKREHERAIWRIAQFVEEHTVIKGLITSSWLYAIETREVSPNLGWLREFYALENARITPGRRLRTLASWWAASGGDSFTIEPVSLVRTMTPHPISSAILGSGPARGRRGWNYVGALGF